MSEPNVTLNFKIESDLKERFKLAVKDNDRTASVVLRDFIRDYIAKNELRKQKEGVNDS